MGVGLGGFVMDLFDWGQNLLMLIYKLRLLNVSYFKKDFRYILVKYLKFINTFSERHMASICMLCAINSAK